MQQISSNIKIVIMFVNSSKKAVAATQYTRFSLMDDRLISVTSCPLSSVIFGGF